MVERMKLSELQQALESHLDRDPPSEPLTEMHSDVAVLDATLVGVAFAIVEHDGSVLPTSLSAISAISIEIEWFVQNSTLSADPFLASLRELSQLVETWIIQNTAQ